MHRRTETATGTELLVVTGLCYCRGNPGQLLVWAMGRCGAETVAVC